MQGIYCHLSVCLSVCLFLCVYPFVCVLLRQKGCYTACCDDQLLKHNVAIWPIWLSSICLSICVFVFVFVCTDFLAIYNFCLFVCLSVCLSISLGSSTGEVSSRGGRCGNWPRHRSADRWLHRLLRGRLQLNCWAVGFPQQHSGPHPNRGSHREPASETVIMAYVTFYPHYF